MSGTNGHAEAVSKNLQPPTLQTLDRRTKQFSEPLIWDDPSKSLAEFHAIASEAPLHSVVITFSPAAAEQILRVTNTNNRPMGISHAAQLGRELKREDFELTGDTVKFAKGGTMLDGQHRLQACVKMAIPLTTHVVFGLDKSIFDILDRGKARTAAHILAREGVPEATIVAAAISWVLRMREFENGRNREGGIWLGGDIGHITPRVVRKLARREMKDMPDYAKDGKLINAAFKHPPSLVTAVLYLIGQHSEALAHEFAHEWVHGARRGRNQNFDVLSGRFIKIARQSGGHINRVVRAALIVQAFNHWNARIVASERSLTWRTEWRFPALEFDAEAFIANKDRRERDNSSLQATQMRVLKALADNADEGVASISYGDIAKASNTPKASVAYIISTLIDDELISRESEGTRGKIAASYRLNTDKWKENARV